MNPEKFINLYNMIFSKMLYIQLIIAKILFFIVIPFVLIMTQLVIPFYKYQKDQIVIAQARAQAEARAQAQAQYQAQYQAEAA